MGLVAWLLGFALEVTADFQKYAFKQDPANKGRYIDTGASQGPTGAPYMCCSHLSSLVTLLGLGPKRYCSIQDLHFVERYCSA